MIINHNISSIDASRNLANNGVAQTKNMQQLSSGLRITRATDDASGLAVAEKMRAQIRGLNQAVRNINDGIALVQTTEGYLQGTTDAVQRIRELAVQAANGVYSEEDRTYMQIEVSQLVREVDRIAGQAQFNDLSLLMGQLDGTNNGQSLVLQIGANMDQQILINIGRMDSEGIGLTGAQGEGGIDITTAEGANRTIGTLDQALLTINKQRANLGAYQNRLEFSVKAQMTASQNLQASESQIRDLDMAQGASDRIRNEVLMQTGLAMLAQANQRKDAVLRLLQ